MRVAIVSGGRSSPPMGLELAEMRLLAALRSISTEMQIDLRVVGARQARRHAGRTAGQWVPARPGTLPPWATTRCELVHLIGLDLPPPRGKPFVAMVHDLSPVHFEDEGTLPPWVGAIARDAGLILTPSRFTADEVQRYLGVPEDRVRVIGGAPALDAAGAPQLTREELSGLGITPPFVLRCGGYTKRKNVPFLLEAWSRVGSGTLVLTGPAQPVRERVLAAAPSLDRVVVLDYVPDALLARLIRTATALVSTSSYEGFGLPVLEALAAGTPVVAVAEPFVREVCGGTALLVDRSAEAVAAAMHEVLADDRFARCLGRAGALHAGQFSWAQCAARLVDAYASASTST